MNTGPPPTRSLLRAVAGGPVGPLHFVMLMAVSAGVFFRFWQLGGAPLAVDEYYFASSILNILERGLPAFPCGGYYTRGILVQYLTVPLLGLGFGLESAIRFWPAVASLLTVWAVWRIAIRIGGAGTACIAVVLCSLSLWEIEFARFGRMYAPFQAIAAWYLYFQMLHLVEGRGYARWVYLALSAVAMAVYAGGALLLALNFLALIWRGKRWTVAHLATSSVLLLAGAVHQALPYRYLGAAPAPAADAVESSSLAGSLPVSLPTIPEPVLPLAALALAGLALLAWRHRSSLHTNHPSILFWLAAALALCFGLVAFALALVAAGLLFRLPFSNGHAPGIRPSAGVVALGGIAVLWIASLFILYGSTDHGAWPALKASLSHVLNYPDVYYKVVLAWLQAIPVTAVAVGLLVLASLRSAFGAARADDSTQTNLRYLMGVLILLLLLVALLEQPYRTTRYTYFLYPILLVLAAAGIRALPDLFRQTLSERRKALLTAFSFAFLFAFAEDFRLQHLLNINEPEYRFRMAYEGRLASHYYTRWDYRSTAVFVNERLAPDDTVIVFDQPASHYLARTDGMFIRKGDPIHYLTAACGGQRHLWSNAPLLDEDSEVDAVLERRTGSAWFVMRTENVAWRDKLESSLIERFDMHPQYVSIDGNLAVYRLGSAAAD